MTSTTIVPKKAPSERVPPRPARTSMRSTLAKFSGAYVLVAFVITYSLWIPSTFLTSTTIQTILADQAVIGLVAIGLIFALSAGAFDLSFAANLGLCGVVCATLMTKHDVSPILAILATLAVGVLVGAVNAVLVVGVGVSSIAVTLGTSSLLAAANSYLSDGGQFIIGLPEPFKEITQPRIAGLPIVAFYLLVVATVAWYVLERTPLGRRLQATGSGPEAAKLAGVNTNRMITIAFLVAGFMAALAGIIATSRIGVGSPSIGNAYLLPVFAAVFLGTTQVRPGRYNVWGTVLAILLLATGVKGLQLVGGEPWITDAFNGAALILAVSLAVVGQRLQRGRSKANASH